MRITNIQEARVPIASEIRNAVINFSRMDVSVIKITTDVTRGGRPVTGYGFNSNGRYSQGGILQARIIPRLLEADRDGLLDETGENLDPHRAWEIMLQNEKPGGHGERSVAVGVVDMALWDIVAKIEERPLFRVLSERFGTGQPDRNVFVYAAGGYYYPSKGIEQLRAEVASYLELGYSTIKIKIGGDSLSEDLKRIDAIARLLGDDYGRLAVDANGRLDLSTALAYADELAVRRPFWFEEAGDPLDFELQSAIADSYPGALATGENLFSMQDTRNLLRYAGLRPALDYLQMDPALSYGLVEYLRMARVMGEYGWSLRRCIPHGGHQFALHIAAGLDLGGNESYPGVFEPFGGFGDRTVVNDGYVTVPDCAGIGFEANSELMRIFTSVFG